MKWNSQIQKEARLGVNNHRVTRRLIHSVLLLLSHQCARARKRKKQAKAIIIIFRAV